MREVLEPLALIAGVRMTSIVSSDGVPVASLPGLQQRGEGGSTVADLDADVDLGSASAQVAAWVSDVARPLGKLSWNAPERLVLRGTQGTLLWFVEEVGELARALKGQDRENLEEEFADVLAWLVTLASIAGVDVAQAARKYADGCPRCARTPCVCPPRRDRRP